MPAGVWGWAVPPPATKAMSVPLSSVNARVSSCEIGPIVSPKDRAPQENKRGRLSEFLRDNSDLFDRLIASTTRHSRPAHRTRTPAKRFGLIAV